MNRFSLALLCTFMLIFCAAAQSKDKKPDDGKKPAAEKDSKDPKVKKKDIPVNITADHMKYDEVKNLVYFTGNVHVDDGAMKVNSDKMTVKLDKNQDPVLIICNDNVVIRKEGSTSYSDRAEYFLPEEKIVLTGKPKVIRTNNKGEKQTMTGRVITFFKNTNIIETQGVGMVFPGSSKKKEEKKPEPKKVEKK